MTSRWGMPLTIIDIIDELDRLHQIFKLMST